MLSVMPHHCTVQRSLEELEQCMLALEQKPCSHKGPSISDSEVVSDGDDDFYETTGPCLVARPAV